MEAMENFDNAGRIPRHAFIVHTLLTFSMPDLISQLDLNQSPLRTLSRQRLRSVLHPDWDTKRIFL